MSSETAWLPEGLEPVALRLARANDAALEVGELALAWSRGGPISVSEKEGESGTFRIVVDSVRPIPPLISMLFSEAINHLRSAVENTIFYLVERERGAPLSEKQARYVEMPILEEKRSLDDWLSSRAKKGVPELGPNSKLGNRISSLQPFNDSSVAPSVSAPLVALMDVDAELAAPLLLLRRYSNEDKHRTIRMAVPEGSILRSGVPFSSSDRGMRPLEPGQVLIERKPNESFEVTLSPAVFVRRPETSISVAPLPELDRLNRHVSQIVVPTLVLGMALSKSLPPEIDLKDNGMLERERLDSGTWRYAHERVAGKAIPAFLESLSEPPTTLSTSPDSS